MLASKHKQAKQELRSRHLRTILLIPRGASRLRFVTHLPLGRSWSCPRPRNQKQIRLQGFAQLCTCCLPQLQYQHLGMSTLLNRRGKHHRIMMLKDDKGEEDVDSYYISTTSLTACRYIYICVHYVKFFMLHIIDCYTYKSLAGAG